MFACSFVRLLSRSRVFYFLSFDFLFSLLDCFEMAAVGDGSLESVEMAFRQVVGNALALHSLIACGSDEVEQEKEREGAKAGEGERRRSMSTSIFESLCSLSSLQDNERTLFFSTI